MSRMPVLVAAGACLLSACTALGAWVYDTPRFTVTAMRYAPSSGGGDHVEVTLTGCNINEYDLIADSLEVRLSLAGRPVSSTWYAAAVALPMRDSAQIVVALPVPESRIREFRGEEAHRGLALALQTSGTVRTPMGPRIVTSEQRGTLRAGDGTALAFGASAEAACRPGLSLLPPAEGRGTWTSAPAARPPEAARPELPPGMSGVPGER